MKRLDTKCPECGESIFHLVQVQSVVMEYKIMLDKHSLIDFAEIGSRDDGEVIHYECPLCEEVVCYGFAEAEKILRGEAK